MRRSNGDYGSDKAEVQLTAALELLDSAELALPILLAQARQAVEMDLSRSPSLNVRRQTITEYRTCSRCGERLPDEERSYVHKACKEAEDAEREARYQELKARELEKQAQAWAESNAIAEERAMVGVAADDDDEDDDDDERAL
jgi:hypothetical protein